MISAFVGNLYGLLKTLHLFAAFAWMAGLFYLPRLYVYHTTVDPKSEASQTFKVMEEKLLKIIMNPAMIATFAFGLWLTFATGVVDLFTDRWLQIKVVLAVGLVIVHGFLAKWRRDFANDRNQHSERFYRAFNEIPTLLLLGILLMVILRPF